MPCAHWAAASRALRTFAAPRGTWGRARCQGTWHRTLRGRVAGRAGPLPCFRSRRPRAPVWGVFQDSKPVGPGIGCVLGGWGSTGKGGSGDMGCLHPGTPGTLGWRGHLEARVLAWESSRSVHSACAKQPGTRASGGGAGREGRFWVLLKRQHSRRVAVCAEVRLPCSPWCWWERPPPLH